MTRHQRLWTHLGSAEVVATAALVAGVCGIVATVPVYPPVQATLLLVFMLAGPGCAALCWADFPPAVTVAAVVGVSVAAVFAMAVAMAWLGWWSPIPSCLLLSVVAIISGSVRLRVVRTSNVGS